MHVFSLLQLTPLARRRLFLSPHHLKTASRRVWLKYWPDCSGGDDEKNMKSLQQPQQ